MTNFFRSSDLRPCPPGHTLSLGSPPGLSVQQDIERGPVSNVVKVLRGQGHEPCVGSLVLRQSTEKGTECRILGTDLGRSRVQHSDPLFGPPEPFDDISDIYKRQGSHLRTSSRKCRTGTYPRDCTL